MILQKEFFQLLSLSLFVAIINPLMAAATEHPGSQSNELRKSNGRPALQGVWDFRTITPLERPEELKKIKRNEVLSPMVYTFCVVFSIWLN